MAFNLETTNSTYRITDESGGTIVAVPSNDREKVELITMLFLVIGELNSRIDTAIDIAKDDLRKHEERAH